MTKPTRECILCGGKYKFCGYCEADRNEPKWRFLFDTENCRDIFHAISDYKLNEISVNKAKNVLDKCDLSIQNNCTQAVKDDIAEIYEQANGIENINGGIENISIIKENNNELENKTEVETNIEPEVTTNKTKVKFSKYKTNKKR